ncbi:MAG: TolC family protein [Gemmatimonadota bacterium]
MLANSRLACMLLIIVTTFATGVHAQQQAVATLTLAEAITLARRNNPDFLAQKNDLAVAEWGVREAYGGLLPGASASTSFQYQAAGTPRLGFISGSDLGVTGTPAYYLSNYYVGINYGLSGASLLAPGRAKATRHATDAYIAAADFQLAAAVTRQYLAVRRAQDGVALAKQELERAEDNRKLADARLKVGAATPIELKQAEVEKGRAEVTLLQSENLVRTERLRLMQGLGIDMNTAVELTTDFTIGEIPWSQEELINIAMQQHPNLLAARANEQAGNASVKMAKSAYLPSLSFNAGLSGYTRQAGSSAYLLEQAQAGALGARQQCEFFNAVAAGSAQPIPGYPQSCPAGTLTAAQERAIISGNNVFPFSYTGEPLSASLQISLPIFQGFTRELQLEQARAGAADARYRLRAEELRLRADVATAYLNATTARQSVGLEQRNTDLAADQLKLARERYRLGAASFLELQDAATIKARADRAYLMAVYSFHESMAALESAVGRSLK